MGDNNSISIVTEDPSQNNLSGSIASLNDLAIKVVNITLKNVIAMLSDSQKSQLMFIDSELGFECLLKNWFKRNMDTIQLTENLSCNATWDKTSQNCLPAASVGAEVTENCPENEDGEIIRHCLSNGTWSMGDACIVPCESLSCIFEPNGNLSLFVGHMVFVGSICSILCLSISLAIFYCFRSIWSQRLTLQVHFMLALLLRFVILFVISEPSFSYRNDDILCKFLVIAYLFSCTASVMWMLVQGMYLNAKLTTNVIQDESKKKIRFYYFLGWIFPAVVLLAYLIFMLENSHQEMCWKGYPQMTEIWIVLTPILVALSFNAVFLLNILRVVISKSHCFNSASESAKLVSIAKATGILFPVLGVNNMLLVYNPGGKYEKYFILINAFFGSTQGVLVSIVYCVMSKDVQRAIRLSYNRLRVRGRFSVNRRRTHRESCL